ncbi:MAG: DUF1592 domain-containing protein [Fuerstiella sp.]|nr:DUF1592 domain-containing protein [Fuerstiella sp.]MCP4853175.1 DUF1592 domain-containing protein [Fuerstiella sp.]
MITRLSQSTLVCLFTAFAVSQSLCAATLATDLDALVQSSCIACHDANTDTQLNFESLDDDLTNSDTFRQWEKIYDRTQSGEMPPVSEPRPDEAISQAALKSLRTRLRETNRAAQEVDGRVPTRRLTRLEYEYTLHDLLGVRGELARHLPPENASSAFDTVAVDQGISLVHIRSYLAAADVALDEAIQLGPRPRQQPVEIKYQSSPYSTMWIDRPLRNGGSTVKLVDDAWVTFETREHAAQSNHIGYRPQYPGLYRIAAEVYGYQARTPVTMTLYRRSKQQGGAELIAAFDLMPGQSRTVEVTSYFTPDDYFYPAPADHDFQPDGRTIYANIGAKNYRGEALAVKWLTIEGPLEEHWPPERTRRVFHGMTFKRQSPKNPQPGNRKVGNGASDDYQVELTRSPREHLADIIRHLGPLAFRRPLKDGEAEGFVRLAEQSLSEGRPFKEVVRVPLQTILSSPQFLFHAGDPGRLDDYALATRLSYFLWKSLPDEELRRLAAEQKLLEPDVLAGQVDRMLGDRKSDRFVHDFLDQWLELRDIDGTTPDEKLYPEYDDVLRRAMLGETRHFLRELISENLSVRNLIDSEFTFLNRRLAVHYGLEQSPDTPWPMPLPADALGNRASHHWPREKMRRVELPEDSVRGGLLAHASIHKVTANGTITSPVKRGNFVLARVLGTPPNPPPFFATVEPDTRGTTTIRETLDAHRNDPACNNCHRTIDPPGFAMESFDPIGGFRKRYRSTDKGDRPQRKLLGRSIYEYNEGLPVDASGVTSEGEAFDEFRTFKRLLLQSEQLVARNFISQLIVYATGGEIQFADREELDRIVQKTGADGYPVRTILHEIVQSDIFRNK